MFNCAKCQSRWDLRSLFEFKKNKYPIKKTNIKKLKFFMNSLSNSSNKAEKQMFEAKTVI